MKCHASGTHNINGQVKLKTIMLKLRFCDCIDVHILVKGTITVAKQGAESVTLKTDKKVKPINK